MSTASLAKTIYTAAEDLAELTWVRISGNKLVSKAIANSEANLAIGVTAHSVVAGGAVAVVDEDRLKGLEGILPNQHYFLSQISPGEMVSSEPLAGIVQRLAIGIDTDEIEVDIGTVQTGGTELLTPNEKAALAGTAGTPSGSNRYVTEADPRLYTKIEENYLGSDVSGSVLILQNSSLSSSEDIFINGLLQRRTVDYNVTHLSIFSTVFFIYPVLPTNLITVQYLVKPAIPLPPVLGDILVADTIPILTEFKETDLLVLTELNRVVVDRDIYTRSGTTFRAVFRTEAYVESGGDGDLELFEIGSSLSLGTLNYTEVLGTVKSIDITAFVPVSGILRVALRVKSNIFGKKIFIRSVSLELVEMI